MENPITEEQTASGGRDERHYGTQTGVDERTAGVAQRAYLFFGHASRRSKAGRRHYPGALETRLPSRLKGNIRCPLRANVAADDHRCAPARRHHGGLHDLADRSIETQFRHNGALAGCTSAIDKIRQDQRLPCDYPNEHARKRIRRPSGYSGISFAHPRISCRSFN